MSNRRGYTLGRLLAALDHLQAVPDVERLYGLASTDPRHLVAPLQRATALGGAARDYLMPLVASLPAEPDPFGSLLSNEEQSDFGLGYYHQRHDIAAGRPPGFDDEITVAEAAEMLGISRQTVHQAIRLGRLAAREDGPRRTILRRADVERYARERKAAPPRPESNGLH